MRSEQQNHKSNDLHLLLGRHSLPALFSLPDNPQQGEVGPVISAESRDHIVACIDKAVSTGGELLVDGRHWAERQPGTWVGPTIILKKKDKNGREHSEEIFGPVITVIKASECRHRALGDGSSCDVWTWCTSTVVGNHFCDSDFCFSQEFPATTRFCSDIVCSASIAWLKHLKIFLPREAVHLLAYCKVRRDRVTLFSTAATRCSTDGQRFVAHLHPLDSSLIRECDAEFFVIPT